MTPTDASVEPHLGSSGAGRAAYFVLPHREPAWKIISERLSVLTDTCAALAQEPDLSALGDMAYYPAERALRHEHLRDPPPPSVAPAHPPRTRESHVAKCVVDRSSVRARLRCRTRGDLAEPFTPLRELH
jgi:hypothetical protein